MTRLLYTRGREAKRHDLIKRVSRIIGQNQISQLPQYLEQDFDILKGANIKVRSQETYNMTKSSQKHRKFTTSEKVKQNSK